MEKIKLITDSACDIPVEEEKRLGITILPVPITINTDGYYERESFTFDEFYDILEKSETLPLTSHIVSVTYQEQYEKAYEEGYEHVIVVSIYSGASSMNFAAHQGAEDFFQQYPDAVGKMTIDVLDSKSFTLGYGYPLMEAAKSIQNGAGYEEVLAYLKDTFEKVEVYFCPFTLQYVKKSGRVSCAAAFVGELLGLRPIISMTKGPSSVVGKVRGNNAVNPYLQKIVLERAAKQSPYVVLQAKNAAPALELSKMLEKSLGYPCVGIYKIGASIAINAGPDVVGVAFLGKGSSEQ